MLHLYNFVNSEVLIFGPYSVILYHSKSDYLPSPFTQANI